MCEDLRESYRDDYLSLIDDQLTPSFLNNEVDTWLTVRLTYCSLCNSFKEAVISNR